MLKTIPLPLVAAWATVCLPILGLGMDNTEAAEPAQVALQDKPGYLPIDEILELGEVTPQADIHLPKFLLNEVIAGLDKNTTNMFADMGIDPYEVVEGIDRIRLLVLPAGSDADETLSPGLARLRAILRESWVPLLSVPRDNLGIYTVPDATGRRMGGLALLAEEDDELIIMNITGRIPLGAMLRVASRLDALPTELFARLAQFGSTWQTGASPEEAEVATKEEMPRKQEEHQDNALIIQVNADSEIYWDGQPITLEAMSSRFEELHQEARETAIVLEMHEDTLYRQVRSIVNLAHKYGFREIRFRTEDGE